MKRNAKGLLNSWELSTLRRLIAETKYQPRIYLVTSNAVKVSHFQHIFGLFGVPLFSYATATTPYSEPHDCSPEESLISSIAAVVSECRKKGFFFIEDSTFELAALSTEARSVPGLETKSFLRKYNLHEIERMINETGGERSAKITSRLALHLGRSLPEEIFEHSTYGRIASTDEVTESRCAAPWLFEDSPANFFIPSGEHTPLSSLPLERSYDYDTRFGVSVKLLYRLATYAGVAENLQSYFQNKRPPEAWTQISLFEPKTLLVVGYSGSGKTTASIYLSRRFGLPYYEQSNLVKIIAERAGIDQGNLTAFCDRLLAEKGPLEFVRRSLYLHGIDRDNPFILSGLRNPEEVNYMRSTHGGAAVLFVDCEFDLRCHRRMLSADGLLDGFAELEAAEKRWGMEKVRALSDIVVRNNGSIDKYFDDLDLVGQKLFR